MNEYMIVNVGYEQLYGHVLPLEEAVARLKLYPLRLLLEIFSKADTILALTSSEDFADGHRMLSEQLLTPSLRHAVLKFYESFQGREATKVPVILFHELQILNALKLALLHCEEHVPTEPDDPGPLVEALLIINDHIDPPTFKPDVFDTLPDEQQRDALIRYVVPNMVFHRGTRLAHVIARWNDLFYIDAPSLVGRPEYIDLRSTLTQLLGLDSKLFYCFANALIMHWLAIPRETIITGQIALHLPTWLRDFSISTDEYEPTMQRLAGTPDLLKAQLGARKEWEPYYFLPIQTLPYLRYQDVVFCLSRRFATEKISSGLYHTVLTHRDAKERDKFLVFFGHVFESYIRRLFNRVFPAGPLAQRFFANPRDPATGDELTDGILDYGDALVLVETKASLFSLPVLLRADPAVLDRQLQDIVFDAARQLTRAIVRIRAGALVDLGIFPERIKTYFPIVVSLQFIPVEHFLYRKFQQGILSKDLLQGRDIAPLQLLSVDDIEWVESFLISGVCLADLLRAKVSDSRLLEMSFGNFAVEHLGKEMRRPSPYLGSRWTEMGEEVLGFFRSRARNA